MSLIFKTLDSTQTELKKMVSSDALPHLDYVLAHEQTAGRGRQGREWFGESGNLYLSVWLQQTSLPLTWVPHWVAMSLRRTCISFGVPPARLLIKWPNDLMVDANKKLAGILCEKWQTGIVVGVGLNLIKTPAELDRPVASLRECVPDLNLEDLNVRFTERLIALLSIEPGLETLKRAYEEATLLKRGDEISWTDIRTGESGCGSFLHYGDHGELIADQGDEVRALFSEEIHLVRKP